MFGTLLTAAMAANCGLGGCPLPGVQGPTWKCPAYPQASLAFEIAAAAPEAAAAEGADNSSPPSLFADIGRRLSEKAGGMLGAGAGAAIGAKVGFMIGGPAGAIIGGFIGGFLGGGIGEAIGGKAVKPQ